MLIKVDDNNTSIDSRYLDVSRLTEGELYEDKLAYLESYNSRVSDVTGKGYFTLKLKDCNANTIMGTFFDNEEFVKHGNIMSELKRKPVNVSFDVKSFNGEMRLTIREISINVADSLHFDFPRFIGIVKGSKELLSTSELFISRMTGDSTLKLNPEMATSSIDGLNSGKCGGYSLMISMVTHSLIPIADLDNVDKVTLMGAYCHIANIYFKYKKKCDTDDIYTTYDKVEFIGEEVKHIDGVVKHIVGDSMSELMGLGKCESIYSNILVPRLLEAERTLYISNVYTLMPTFSIKEIGGRTLRKY